MCMRWFPHQPFINTHLLIKTTTKQKQKQKHCIQKSIEVNGNNKLSFFPSSMRYDSVSVFSHTTNTLHTPRIHTTHTYIDTVPPQHEKPLHQSIHSLLNTHSSRKVCVCVIHRHRETHRETHNIDSHTREHSGGTQWHRETQRWWRMWVNGTHRTQRDTQRH